MTDHTKRRGDHLPLFVEVVVPGVADSTAGEGVRAWFTVKRDRDEPDSAAIMQLTYPGGGIETQAPNRFLFTIGPEHEGRLSAEDLGTALYWDFQYKGADGKIKTTDEGALRIKPHVTHAT